MKKKIIILLTMFTLLAPMTTHAQKCLITKGDGTQIGDEIKCGTEEFYVTSVKDGVVKMLAKYNLMIGDEINADSFVSKDIDAVEKRCQELRDSGEFNDVLLTLKINPDLDTGILDAKENTYFCRTYKTLKYDKVVQSPKAKGLTVETIYEGKENSINVTGQKLLYPMYGSVYFDFSTVYNYDSAVYDKMFKKVAGKEIIYDLILKESPFYDYANEYKKTLSDLKIKIKDVGILNYDDFYELSEKIAPQILDENSSLNIVSTSEAVQYKGEMDTGVFVYTKKNIKNQVKNGYEWLYSTSYWLGFANYTNMLGDSYDGFFITEAGDLCSLTLGCMQPKLGLGYRPLLTINSTELTKYTYEITEGAEQTLPKNQINSYELTIDVDLSIIDKIEIGDNTFEKDVDFKIDTENSKIVFTDKGIEKLNSLEDDEYGVKILCTDDEVIIGKLTIEVLENPETGIIETLGYSIMFIIVALILAKKISKKELFRRI